jgi:hypothetical protein
MGVRHVACGMRYAVRGIVTADRVPHAGYPLIKNVELFSLGLFSENIFYICDRKFVP